ncbi:hypothetical protein SAMN05880593_12355 [Rhizobium sp. RU36D]|nr:hypothetical protein SAMN05880593_12355 [Rhizobium sp. RU36D]
MLVLTENLTVMPAAEPASSAIKSLIAKDSFHGADTPWLDSGLRRNDG